MGEEKRKRATAEEATENPLKSPRLEADAAEALLELSNPPSTGEAEATTDEGTYDIGSCEHLFKGSEELDDIAYDLKAADYPPMCEHDPCSTTWRGAAGMMVCTECCCTFCTGEKGDRENPQGHARWHAARDQHWVALWCDEQSKGYCFECGRVLMLGQNKCLLALGKLRTMILRPDARLGNIGLRLKQLFVETESANNATHMLDPKMILEDMRSLYPKRFEPKVMGDSQEFLTSLYDALDNEVEQLNSMDIMQGDAPFPTFFSSIFRCELIETISCKSRSHNEVRHLSCDALQLPLPSKDPPARSKPLQVESTEVKDDVSRGIVEVPVKVLDIIPKLFDDIDGMEESTADSHNPEEREKAQSSDTIRDVAEHMNSSPSIKDCLKLFSYDLTNCNNCSEVAAELPETNGTKIIEPIMASTNQNTTVHGDQTELPDRKPCPSERSSDFSSLSVESPNRQPDRSDSHHQVILSEEITSEEVTSGKSCGEKDLAFCSTANEQAESHEGAQEATPSCLTTDEQTDLMSAQDIQDTSTQKQGSGKPVNYDHSAQQVSEKQNKQTDGNDGAIQTQLISKLPPVLTIQVERYTRDLSKLSGHVSFKEILHVGPFMHPSSEDKDNLSYRLVGIIEHIGGGLNSGHYIAYVRASRGQHGCVPSSWVCANDSIIRRVSLEEVLGREAYILFYERIDD